jgi:hypothetical protein
MDFRANAKIEFTKRNFWLQIPQVPAKKKKLKIVI